MIIDDNNYKLAKMQESLLKVATEDRHYHLDNYIKTITQIDRRVFNELLDMVQKPHSYSQPLETELEYLESIYEAYNRLLELQTKFRTICEQYGENNLNLSDISQIDIEYIINRIEAIKGYLLNVRNIDANKKKLEILNEQLADEEKKRDFLNKKILILEKKLRDEFVYATFKEIVFGKLVTSDNVISEYERLGYDVRYLIEHADELNKKYSTINEQFVEINERYNAAKMCYSNVLSSDSENVMEEIKKEFYKTKYKYIMLKILKLLVCEVETYDSAKKKREDFIKLLEERYACLKELGISNPVDILRFIDIDGQIADIDSLIACVENIHVVRREIGELTTSTEEMINQNSKYLILLSDTKDLIKSTVGLNDVDITAFDDIASGIEDKESEKEVLGNQVVRVVIVPLGFKLDIARQKANGVISRVMKLNNDVRVPVKKTEYVPELVIVPKESVVVNKESPVLPKEKDIEILDPVIVSDALKVDVVQPMVNEVQEQPVVEAPLDIFETVTPFDVEPVMFADRTDNGGVVRDEKVSESVAKMSSSEVLFPESNAVEEIMPDAFWITGDSVKVESDEPKLSFEDQISALLATNTEPAMIKRVR